MQNLETRTIREIAVSSPATTSVFEQYKIDYCCHGDTMFDEACHRAGASPDVIRQKIKAVLGKGKDREPLADLTLTQLTDHIVDKHHIYTKQELEQLPPLMEKVVGKHGEHNSQLVELKWLFRAVCDDLTPHMLKEETVLFPYIKRLEANVANGRSASSPSDRKSTV